MPLKNPVIVTDRIKFTTAADLLSRLQSKGVPVAGLSEEVSEGDGLVYVPVTDPNWEDDGQSHVFYASIFGKFQDVASVYSLMTGVGENLSKFLNLAAESFVTDSANLTKALAFQAVDALPGVLTSANAALDLGYPAAPVVKIPITPGTTINGVFPQQPQ